MYYENVRREKGKEQYNNKQHRLFFQPMIIMTLENVACICWGLAVVVLGNV